MAVDQNMGHIRGAPYHPTIPHVYSRDGAGYITELTLTEALLGEAQ